MKKSYPSLRVCFWVALLIISLVPICAGLIAIQFYYSKSNLLLIRAPLTFAENSAETALTIQYVVPEGRYQCFLIVLLPQDSIANVEGESLMVTCEFQSQIETKRKELGRILLDSHTVANYLADYQAKKRMVVDSGGEVLPYPWTYMDRRPWIHVDDSTDEVMKIPIGSSNFYSDGESGGVSVNLRRSEGLKVHDWQYVISLERFFDAV